MPNDYTARWFTIIRGQRLIGPNPECKTGIRSKSPFSFSNNSTCFDRGIGQDYRQGLNVRPQYFKIIKGLTKVAEYIGISTAQLFFAWGADLSDHVIPISGYSRQMVTGHSSPPNRLLWLEAIHIAAAVTRASFKNLLRRRREVTQRMTSLTATPCAHESRRTPRDF